MRLFYPIFHAFHVTQDYFDYFNPLLKLFLYNKSKNCF